MDVRATGEDRRCRLRTTIAPKYPLTYRFCTAGVCLASGQKTPDPRPLCFAQFIPAWGYGPGAPGFRSAAKCICRYRLGGALVLAGPAVVVVVHVAELINAVAGFDEAVS